MKSVLFFLMMLAFITVNAQNISVTISTGYKTIIVAPDEKNDDKSLSINKSQTGYLNIKVVNDDTAWKRHFFIVDDAGNDIVQPVVMKENEYCVTIKNLLENLQTSKDYFLYTWVLPKDPQKAMLVKVPRKLLCRIRIN